MVSKEYINSKIVCPVCNLEFAKNYLKTHLNKQHTNIFGTKEWEGSRYEKNFERIKEEHKKKFGIDKVKC
jgi:uncharacterized C2H2 Zn-finger protein